MQTLDNFLADLAGTLWGLPMVTLLIGTGVYFCIILKGIPLTGFTHAISVVRGKFDKKDDPGEINHFKALCTALSATVGLGNIAGVAVAIKMGGPGATVWMILAGVVGMATKYAECTLAIMYRHVDEKGVVHGGPMHYIKRGLGNGKSLLPDSTANFLAYMFATCCMLACFGGGNMFQANQVASSLNKSFEVPPEFTGFVLAALVGVVVVGGIKRIGSVAGTLVPLMGALYVGSCLLILFINASQIPEAVVDIITAAFTGTAAVGGFAGAAVKEVLKQGVRRAVFSSEAGLGSAAIAHSAAKTDEPVREGVVALLEPFIDTVVICTMTALVINITGVWQGDLEGVQLTQAALDHSVPGLGTYFIPVAVALFAYSTMISWCYYGERSVDFLFGEKAIMPFKIIFCLAVVAGANWKIGPILNFADSAFALMVIPNATALLLMSGTIKQATVDYFSRLKAGEFEVQE